MSQRRVNLMTILPDTEETDEYYDDTLYPVLRVLAHHHDCRDLLYRWEMRGYSESTPYPVLRVLAHHHDCRDLLYRWEMRGYSESTPYPLLRVLAHHHDCRDLLYRWEMRGYSESTPYPVLRVLAHHHDCRDLLYRWEMEGYFTPYRESSIHNVSPSIIETPHANTGNGNSSGRTLMSTNFFFVDRPVVLSGIRTRRNITSP